MRNCPAPSRATAPPPVRPTHHDPTPAGAAGPTGNADLLQTPLLRVLALKAGRAGPAAKGATSPAKAAEAAAIGVVAAGPESRAQPRRLRPVSNFLAAVCGSGSRRMVFGGLEY